MIKLQGSNARIEVGQQLLAFGVIQIAVAALKAKHQDPLKGRQY